MIFRYFRLFFIVSVSGILFACNSHRTPQIQAGKEADTLKNDYSAGFQIIRTDDLTYAKVLNPWQQAQDISITYCLGKKQPENLNENTIFIKTPITRVVCMSTTHIAYLDALEKLDCIKGVSGSAFINNPVISEKIKKGIIPDVGYEQNLNYELIASLKPDLVFAYSVGAEVSGVVAKLKTLNIPVVIVGEYLEDEPLAKAEWVKFFSLFFDESDRAGKIFDTINSQYQEVKKLASKATTQPLVMSSLPWNGTWYISGGQTYMGKLIEHANGNFIWKNETARESQPMDYELVFQKSYQAEIWLNLGSCNSIRDVLQTDARLKSFKAIKNGQLYNNNRRSNASGGNDYWESGTMNPHILLKDLISIFHPGLFPDHQLVYYRKLQ